MSMSKRTTFTTISPLPAGISRAVVVDFLHNHEEMIDLNPLVIERHPITPPAHAPDEERRCVWWSMTDKISYLPGGFASGDITYTAAFNDLPRGIQTHVYAPMGTDIRERWTLGGTLPGEQPEPVELGLGAPREGLYLREDVELRCNFMMSSFVKRTLKKAHGTLVDQLLQKARLATSQADVGADNASNNQRPPASSSSRPFGGDGSSTHSGSASANGSGNDERSYAAAAPSQNGIPPPSRPGDAHASANAPTSPMPHQHQHQGQYSGASLSQHGQRGSSPSYSQHARAPSSASNHAAPDSMRPTATPPPGGSYMYNHHDSTPPSSAGYPVPEPLRVRGRHVSGGSGSGGSSRLGSNGNSTSNGAPQIPPMTELGQGQGQPTQGGQSSFGRDGWGDGRGAPVELE
ncbi:Uu.00g022810.m01.CDS01 [Anthostomella pinea]|uniref:Uu.00g022810.m01.CDS01 n=1 Tax=Anthostomella pinea TaxID=933095 RepID=A0AAI8YNW4_9PEZI|nr:Uu.00g022810.m01.CDS01 [Anthostomella pinea]